jgi:hypothetical protein
MAAVSPERLPERRRAAGAHPGGDAALRARVLGERARISRRSRIGELRLGFQGGLLMPLGVVHPPAAGAEPGREAA